MMTKKVIKIISGIALSFGTFIIFLICILILLGFFGGIFTKDKLQNNEQYASEYKQVINQNLKNGYVPLQRLLYFYLEDNNLNFDALYAMNQDTLNKDTKDIKSVCEDQRLKNMIACMDSTIKENEEYLVVSTKRFNLPLENEFIVTSFFNEQRTIYGNSDTHNGWDLAVPAQTPVYSVCSGTVEKVTFTQNENIPYDQSKNGVGNQITIKCDEDYDETFYVVFAHLYPNSSLVNVGDKVNHFTQVASVGTTGRSTGNHLHYQVENKEREKIDGMQFIDFNLKNSASEE